MQILQGIFQHTRNVLCFFMITAVLLGSAHGYEVQSHQMMAGRTILPSSRAENLKAYLDTFELTSKQYTRMFQNLANSEFSDKGIRVSGKDFVSLIEAGSILEDRDEPGRDGFNGRFYHHFFDPISGIGLDIPVIQTQPNARDWGFNGAGEDNRFSWQMAIEYFEQAVTSKTEVDRTTAEELLFLALGHVVHLTQDSAQPSHTRNDSHSNRTIFDGSSLLEIVGNRRLKPTSVVPRVLTTIDASGSRQLASFAAYFNSIANYSNNQFFSDGTIFTDYLEPSTSTSAPVTLPNETDPSVVETYIGSNALTNTLGGSTRLARVAPSFFGMSTKNILASTGDVVILDNAEKLMAEAVATGEGLLNYFFRAQLELSLDLNDSTKLVVRNISDPSQIASAADATLDSGLIQLLYETADGSYVELMPAVRFSTPLAVDAQLIIDNFGSALDAVRIESLPDSMRIGEDRHIIAFYRGQIGSEAGVVAARASFVDEVSLLLSYDVSGSISPSDLRQAVFAGRRLIMQLSSGEDNRAALHTFSSSAREVVAFTDQFANLDSRLSGLSPGGGTALNDAIVLAGSASQAEANASSNSVVLVLFTDGQENSSSATTSQAVSAISRISHPEIDEVLLVFVGTDTAGASILSNLAAQAGRRFGRIDNFDELSRELLQAIQRAKSP